MARDLIEGDGSARPFLLQAEERLKLPLGRLMLEGPESALQSTEHAQPAILFHSLALLRELRAHEVFPDAVAGHSLGEFGGLVAAEGLEPLDALGAVQARGRAMAEAARAGSGMVAVLGLPDAIVAQVCAEVPGVVPANYNAPGQVVISGTEEALDAAGARLMKAGARRLVRLPVSAAFHSPLMANAATVFREAWSAVPLRELRRPQVFNADAEVHAAPSEVRELMVGQLTGPVRWTASIQRLHALGVDTFIEVGPRRTLTALVKKILPEAVVHNIEDLESMKVALQELKIA